MRDLVIWINLDCKLMTLFLLCLVCATVVNIIYSRVFLLCNFYTHFRVYRFEESTTDAESNCFQWLKDLKGVYNVMVGYVK